MSSIIRVLDRRSGITYVYSSESYWDKEKKAPRNRRKLIGKVDPQTGDVVPTSGTRRRAMERNEEEARKRLREDIQGVDNDRSILSQKYRDQVQDFTEAVPRSGVKPDRGFLYFQIIHVL